METDKMVTKYLLGTFLLSYFVWGIIYLAQEASWFQYGEPISMVFMLIGANSPAIITYFVFKKSKPNYGIKQYFKEAFNIKQKPIYYAITLLFIAMFFVISAIMGGVSTQLEAFSGGTQSSDPMPIWLTAIAIPFFFFLGGSEELGWRHFLQPSLEKKMPFWLATTVTSIIWIIWHLPLFFIIGTSQNSSDILSFSIYAVGTSFALAAIYRVSKSAWLCIFFHCATNSLQGSLPLIDDYLIKSVSSLALIIVAVFVVYMNHRASSSAKILESEPR